MKATLNQFLSRFEEHDPPKLVDKPTKKPKLDDGENSPKAGKENVNISLSPEQKQRIEENRQKALAKLATKHSDPGGILVNVGESWKEALQDEFSKPYFEKLNKFVMSERSKGTVYPQPENVFSWTKACTVNDVKVVILGQDPYHGPNQAHGMAFSVLPGVAPPPSLLNMYKELENDVEGFKRPGHGYLMGWAKQGVLMLNAVLTVRAHQANSHKDQGWERLTDATISYLNKNRSGIVFMLWGSYAQKKGMHIDKSKHHILKGVHPSPLSAHRGYMGCKHFSKCNSLLRDDGNTPIDWAYLPVNPE
ncbi:uracil-DNA glycosylase-like isoform X2 [Mercenaria mercenaria]|uniref:uracil-DNA glycosylase-like isoform X2 n=1 Tax=Mercenaria mercenaria TaxID=6596 RepID=UPI00234F1DAA|nr:uracil-DNA glycosylase-like isoform X2 [Mercenaria mercenaria]